MTTKRFYRVTKKQLKRF